MTSPWGHFLSHVKNLVLWETKLTTCTSVQCSFLRDHPIGDLLCNPQKKTIPAPLVLINYCLKPVRVK